jgi:hypothetical protein
LPSTVPYETISLAIYRKLLNSPAIGLAMLSPHC